MMLCDVCVSAFVTIRFLLCLSLMLLMPCLRSTQDGVYSFESGQLIPYPVEGVCFTFKIDRPFPRNVAEQDMCDLYRRVLDPIFPDAEQRDHGLHSMSRAMAGEVWDKRWYVCMGERNSGKGVLTLMLEGAFGPFVHTINSENLLYTRCVGIVCCILCLSDRCCELNGCCWLSSGHVGLCICVFPDRFCKMMGCC
jgi:hypothetical protein